MMTSCRIGFQPVDIETDRLEANSVRHVQCFAIGMKYFIQALRQYNGLPTFSVHRIPYGGGDLVVKASIS